MHVAEVVLPIAASVIASDESKKDTNRYFGTIKRSLVTIFQTCSALLVSAGVFEVIKGKQDNNNTASLLIGSGMLLYGLAGMYGAHIVRKIVLDKEDKDALKGIIKDLQGKMKDLSKINEDLQNSISTLKQEFEEQIENLNQKIIQLGQENEKFAHSNEKLEIQINGLNDQIQQLSKKLLNFDEENNKLTNSNIELKKQIEELSDEAKEFDGENKEFDQANKVLDQKNKDLGLKIDELEGQIKTIDALKKDLILELDKANANVGNLKNQVADFKKQNEGLKGEVNKLENLSQSINVSVHDMIVHDQNLTLIQNKEAEFVAKEETLVHELQELKNDMGDFIKYKAFVDRVKAINQTLFDNVAKEVSLGA